MQISFGILYFLNLLLLSVKIHHVNFDPGVLVELINFNLATPGVETF